MKRQMPAALRNGFCECLREESGVSANMRSILLLSSGWRTIAMKKMDEPSDPPT